MINHGICGTISGKHPIFPYHPILFVTVYPIEMPKKYPIYIALIPGKRCVFHQTNIPMENDPSIDKHDPFIYRQIMINSFFNSNMVISNSLPAFSSYLNLPKDFWSFPKSQGYPLLSSLCFIGFSIINHPTIGVPPIISHHFPMKYHKYPIQNPY